MGPHPFATIGKGDSNGVIECPRLIRNAGQLDGGSVIGGIELGRYLVELFDVVLDHLALLATLSAYDLGFLDQRQLLVRLDKTITTIESMEKHEGHLLNWYDIRSLAPLKPRYVSTVDSANLAGALLALAAGLRQLDPDQSLSEEEQRLRFQMAGRAETIADSMNFVFLYDRDRRMFSIGYRLADMEGPGSLDTSYYDLLASEARLASFLAIAKGDIPQEHWIFWPILSASNFCFEPQDGHARVIDAMGVPTVRE